MVAPSYKLDFFYAFRLKSPTAKARRHLTCYIKLKRYDTWT